MVIVFVFSSEGYVAYVLSMERFITHSPANPIIPKIIDTIIR